MWPRLLADYLLERRAAGASPRTAAHSRKVLTDVLLPLCEKEAIKTP
jgi:hypothetical protein